MKRAAVNSVFIVSLAVGAIASAVYLVAPEIKPQNSGVQNFPVASVPKIDADSEIKSTKNYEESQASLRATVARLSKEMQEIKALLLAADKVKSAEQNDSAQQVEDLEQQQIKQEEEYESFQKVSKRFNEQAIDSRWAMAATKRIETAMQDGNSEGLDIDSIECRYSMCKLEISNMDEKAMEVFKNKFREQVSDVFNSGMIGKDEFGKTVVYLADNYEDIYD